MGDLTMFPMWARARRVRLAGHALSLREPAAAERYWRREVSAIAIDGMILGISADEIQREIDRFGVPVDVEIRRLHGIYESEKEAAAQTAEIVVFGAPPKFRAEGEEVRKGGWGARHVPPMCKAIYQGRCRMTKLPDAASLAEVGAWSTEYSVCRKSKESRMRYEAESWH